MYVSGSEVTGGSKVISALPHYIPAISSAVQLAAEAHVYLVEISVVWITMAAPKLPVVAVSKRSVVYSAVS